MKTLIKLANSCNKAMLLHGHILFDGNAACATDCETHAVIESGEWNFDCATVVSVQQIKSAMALSKKMVWSGDTLNGVKLVNCMDANDFPTMPDYSGASRIVCDDLPGIVAKTLPASAKDEIRYYLKGLCFDHTAHAVIGCDGHRMHIVKNAYATNLTGQAIVPRDVLDLIGAKNLIHMDFTATHCRIGYVGGYLICRLVDGKFPDYDRVLPADNSQPNVIPFNGEQISAVKSIVAVNKANSRNKYNGMAIAQDGSLSACDITIPCFDGFAMTPDATKFDKHSGEYYGPKIYGVNATYLFDAMSSAGTGTIAVNEVCDSILIVNGDFRAVVMPMRI